MEDAVVAAEAQHDDAVGDGAHVLHVVADHDHAEAAVAHPLDQVRAPRRSARRPSAAVGSSSRMSFGSSSSERAIATVWRWPPESEATDVAHARDARRQFVEQRPGADLHRHFVEPNGFELAAEEDVGDDVEVLAQREILEDGGDAEVERGAGLGQRDGLAVESDRAGARRMHAGEDLDQRRFAGAVVADQRHDLAGVHVEVDVGQRRDGAEILRDAAQAQHQLRLARSRRFGEVSGHGSGDLPVAGDVGGRTVRPTCEDRTGGLVARASGVLMPSFLQPSA